jgi:NAD(P)-dependent dehydrogenase (short-subunit alcohol dehydrogenase family)
LVCNCTNPEKPATIETIFRAATRTRALRTRCYVLRKELRASGIRVYAVAPGVVETEMSPGSADRVACFCVRAREDKYGQRM